MHEIFANVFYSCIILFVLAIVLNAIDLDDLAGWIGGSALLAGLADLAVWAIYWVWA